MKTDDVVVIGEALTDIVEGLANSSEHPGGSPMNVAIGLGRLGVPVSLATSIGSDKRGVEIGERPFSSHRLRIVPAAPSGPW